MYAVIETGGKQYRVTPGDRLLVDRVPGEAGDTVTFDRVLLVVDNDNILVGRPLVEGARVEGKIVRQTRGRKVIVFKFRPKQRYRRKRGHRQYYTEVLVEHITREDGKPESSGTEEPTGAMEA